MFKGGSYALAVIVVLVLGGGGFYFYATAPTKAPSVLVTDQDDTANRENVPNQPTPAEQRQNVMVASGTVMAPPVADGKFHIVSDQSTASFTLNELLRGQPVVVIGKTSQVSGAVQADPANLAATTFETFKINARTFVTDSDMRNNAIRRMILKTEDDANEFIEFTPKTVTGAPAKAVIGQAFTYKITGDLKVSGTTKEVTFDGTGTFVSADQISGSVQTKIHYPDFGVTVPNLPFLANVDQDTTLKLDFIAKK
jgi:polyisoprenoid-binding protein YceI